MLVTLAEYVMPYKKRLFIALWLMLGESVVTLANPWLAGRFTGALLNDESAAGYTWQEILFLWVGVLIVLAVCNFGNRYLIGNTSNAMLSRLRTRLYDHIQSLPPAYFDDKRRGEMLALITYDADVLSNFVTGPFINLLPQFVVLIGALFFILMIDPVLATLVGLLVPLFYLITKIIGRRVRPLSGSIMDEYAKMYSIADENLQMLPVIKSFTREKIESGRFRQSNQRLFALNSRYLWIQSLFSPLMRCIAAMAILFLLWLSSVKLQSGQLRGPELVSLLFYGMLLAAPVSNLADLYGQIQHAKGATKRLLEIFAVSPEPADSEMKALPPVRGNIEFRNVEFSYSGRDKVLCGLDLTIGVGETIAITGKNGCGKSTLVNLLQRFVLPQKGSIHIDGVDIATVSLGSLRSQIGVVPQNVLLLNGSIRENIIYGNPGADEGAVVRAAQAANAFEFIQELPDGFDTLIGEQGIKLSGGQKQRIALARAMLKDPPVLILDEATAMFDPEGEKSFIAECKHSLAHRTVILITHRPASLALAGRVLLLEHGNIMSASPSLAGQPTSSVVS